MRHTDFNTEPSATGKSTALTVGVYVPREVPVSFRNYLDAVSPFMTAEGIELVRFSSPAELPRTADTLWDIRSGGGNAPPAFLLDPALPPLVVTVHGFAPVSLPGGEYFRSWRSRWQHWRGLERKLAVWQLAGPRIAGVIAVSDFTKTECVRYTGIDPGRIVVCHHGVDAGLFAPSVHPTGGPSYYLHISNDEPRKNIERIVEAFGAARLPVDLELVLKLPLESSRRYRGLRNVRVVTGHLKAERLAGLYQGARGFVFPSLYEGFGMPILEAMAAGCPVITSTGTACAEVAGDAALLVDPRQTGRLAAAMAHLHADGALRQRLIRLGHERAASFTWSRSAMQHARCLRNATRPKVQP
jgi:glycosyltransferase involved in cell wall biosynthesis